MDQPGKVANPAHGQLDRENNIPLSPCVPENLVSRDGFSRPVPRQPAHLHTQAESGAYLRDSSRVPRRRPFMKPPYAIGSVPSLSGHANMSFSLRNLPVQACDTRVQGFSPPLTRRRSSCPPPSPNLVRTHPIELYQALRDSAPYLSRAATLPKGTKLGLGRGAHLGTPSSANHTAAASQPTG